MADQRIRAGAELIVQWSERMASLTALARALGEIGSVEDMIDTTKAVLARVTEEHATVSAEVAALRIELEGVRKAAATELETAQRSAAEVLDTARREAERIKIAARGDADEIVRIAKVDAFNVVNEFENTKAALESERDAVRAEVDAATLELENVKAQHAVVKEATDKLRSAVHETAAKL